MPLETYDTEPDESEAEILREAKYNYRKEQAKEVLSKAGNLIKKGAVNIGKGAKQTYNELKPKVQAAIKRYQEKKAAEKAYKAAHPQPIQAKQPSQGQSFISHGQNQINSFLGMGGQQGSNPFGGNGNPFAAIMGNPMSSPVRYKKGKKKYRQEPYNPFKMI